MRIVVAALFVFFLPAQVFAAGTAAFTVPEESAITADATRTVDRFHDALVKGDRQAAQDLLDDQVQIYEQGRVELSKAEYTSHHLESDAAFSAATTSTQTARSVTVLGNLAFVISEGKIAGTFKGKTIDSITLETMVLRREQGGWRIVLIHWSSRDAMKK